MRLDHTDGANDIMRKTISENCTITENDLDEACASDKDPACPFTVSSNVVKGESASVNLIADEDAGIDLTDAVSIDIVSLTGPDFSVTSISWEENCISANITAGPNANHNEVFTVVITFPDRTESYTGILIVTEDAAPEDKFPHAVAGENITALIGEPIVLDGSGSYHDDPSVFMNQSWSIQKIREGDLIGFCDGQVVTELDRGLYVAILTVKDYYGRISTDSITITVMHPSSGGTVPK